MLTTLTNLAFELCIQFCRLFNPKRRGARFVAVLGGPGAGKDTVCRELAPRLGVPELNSGRTIGREVEQKTPFGVQWEKAYHGGELIPDEAIVKLILEELAKSAYDQGAVMNGFPRTYEQARRLRWRLALWGIRLEAVIFLKVPTPDLVERMSLRRTCKKCKRSYHLKFQPPKTEGVCDDAQCKGELIARKDQEPEAIVKRLAEFERTVEQLVRSYEDQGCLRYVTSTNAMGPEQVLEEVLWKLEEVD